MSALFTGWSAVARDFGGRSRGAALKRRLMKRARAAAKRPAGRVESLEQRVLLSTSLPLDVGLSELAGAAGPVVKWSQPPVLGPNQVYNGWDEVSISGGEQIVADDWVCTTADPVTGIEWWGSFLGWDEKVPPQVPPVAFHINIWTDVPAGPTGFSHPGKVIHDTTVTEFGVQFAGFELDPRNPKAQPEAVFHFLTDLPASEWFWQESGTNIYWLSIGAIYPSGAGAKNPFGWTTRPRDLKSPAPDDAVTISIPKQPKVGDSFVEGSPLYWPKPDNSWDTTFVLVSNASLDYGDAPDKPYPTLALNNGARHVIKPGFLLGKLEDSEADGQPNLAATGDDINPAGADDEDGVVFLTPLVPGGVGKVRVTASAAGALNAWIDFGDDGSWGTPGDQIASAVPLVAGANVISFPVPWSAKDGASTYSRFRFSSVRALSYTGPAPDGEVEDYAVKITPREIDTFDESVGHFDVRTPAGQLLGFDLAGPSVWQVGIDPTGYATDTNGDGRDEVATEMVQLSLMGISPLGPVQVREAAAQPSMGMIEEQVNNTSGTLDVAPFVPTGVADSFFDVFFEVDLPWMSVHTAGPVRLGGPISHKPPVAGEALVSSNLEMPLLNVDGFPTGYYLTHVIYVPKPRLDFGDAPTGLVVPWYPTLKVNNGARHTIDGKLYMGVREDAEADGQPEAFALGDDLNPPTGLDDEDGVTFTSVLVAGGTATANVVVSASCKLDAWVDFGQDGNWGTAGDQVFTSLALAAGSNAVVLAVPPGAAAGATFARFRVSYNGGLSYVGLAYGGEVEDYRVVIDKRLPNTKWVQWPDVTQNGIDIFAGGNQVLADDFQCTSTSLLTDVHLWGSWLKDARGKINKVHLSIHSDDPAGPGGPLWERDFASTEVVESLYLTEPAPGEYWWDPSTGELITGADRQIWQLDISIKPDVAWKQLGTTSQPIIYWLDVRVETLEGQWGWKTRRWPDHYQDDAVFGVIPGANWKEMRYPRGHPYFDSTQRSIDMAYALTFQEAPQDQFDWGDAPDTAAAPGYSTLAAHNGARHVIKSGFLLGKLEDAELDGQPNATATGDDINPAGADDEDGVVFNTPMVAGGVTKVTVTASANGGFLNAWMDFNADGDWQDAGEHIFIGQSLAAGPNVLLFAVPANAKAGGTFSRFRFSTVQKLSFDGLAPDGEVEDYQGRILDNEIDPFPGSVGSFDVLAPDGTTQSISLEGSSQWQVAVGPLGESGDTNGNGRDDVQTEMVQLSLTGMSSLGAVMVRESPTRPSMGMIEEQTNNKPGTLDLLPFMETGVADSFFDVYFEVTIDTVPLHTGEPVHLGTVITHKPPNAGEAYESQQTVDLLDANGNPTGYKLTRTIYIPAAKLDWGDAPSGDLVPGYPTLAINNGARHVIKAGVFLGAGIDAEANGQPDAFATGDDLAVSDDEDGVVFTSVLVPGQAATVNVTANVAGKLYAWVDFNGDKDWGDLGEQIFAGTLLAGGVNALTFNVPATATGNITTFSRFRFTRQSAALSYTGLAMDGEVEDYWVQIEQVPSNTKWVQWPDLTQYGIDIKVDQGRVLADDFKCIFPSLLTDVHFWGSWLNDNKGQIKRVHLSIHSDDPAGLDGTDPANNYSKPDNLLWQWDFFPGQFTESLYLTEPKPGEYWWDPVEKQLIPGADTKVWRVDVPIDPTIAWRQEGTTSKPVIYWLDITTDTSEGQFGWKTRRYPDHFADDAVMSYGTTVNWKELRYPAGHPYGMPPSASIDMAYALTFREAPQQQIDWGDAIDAAGALSYPTLSIHNGARHTIKPGYLLGKLEDAEPNGQPNIDATGDDLNPAGSDDEDGVVFKSVLVPGHIARVDVTASAAGILQGWIDFNGDGSWAQLGDQIILDKPVAAGVNIITFPVPASATANIKTYARFRFSSMKGLRFDGPAPDGEVEDYRPSIRSPIVKDPFAGNDSMRTAVDLGVFGQERTGLTIETPGGEDWFQWNALDSGLASFGADFDNNDGNLDLEIYDSKGNKIGESATENNHEEVNIDIFRGEVYYVRALAREVYTLVPWWDLYIATLGNHVNYAVLFAGGANASNNHARYYNNIKDVYNTLVDTHKLAPENIYVLFADGTNVAADQNSGGGVLINSDMSYAVNVQSATSANLETTLTTTMKNAVDANDHFFFYSFDHGGGDNNVPGTTGEESRTTWGSCVADADLADWLGQINAGHSTYVFTQCFAGGMQDNLLPLPSYEHSSAATNHYEYSWGDGFAHAYMDGLATLTRSHDVYWYAYSNDAYATDGEGPGGTVANSREHPWDSSDSVNFPIFHKAINKIPFMYWMRKLDFDIPMSNAPITSGGSNWPITFDMLMAVSNASDPDGNIEGFRVEKVNLGSLTKNGEPVIPGMTIVGFGETLMWTPPLLLGAANGLAGAGPTDYNAFDVRVFDGATISDASSSVILHFEQAGDSPNAVDDTAGIAEDDSNVVIPVLDNDLGKAPLSVLKVGVAMHGTVQLVGGQVIYTPAPNFFGTDNFTYLMGDDTGGTSTATVTVRVKEVNDPPEAFSDEFTISWGTSGNILDVIADDFDTESKPLSQSSPPYLLSINGHSSPSHGTLTLNANQTFSYTPYPGFVGDDSFTYAVTDGQDDSNKATVTIHVVQKPDPLVILGTAKDDTIYVRLDPAGNIIQVFVNVAPGPNPTYSYPKSVPSMAINTLGGSDELIVDLVNGNPIPAGGLDYDGGPQKAVPGDQLTIKGVPASVGAYLPSGTTPGDGKVVADGRTINFTGLEPVVVSSFTTFTITTPNATDQLVMDSLALGTTRISGTSGGVAMESLTVSAVKRLIVDMGTNDALGGSDTFISTAGNVGLALLRINAGTGNNRALFIGGTTDLDTNEGVGGIDLGVEAYSDAVVNFGASQYLGALRVFDIGRVNLKAGGDKVIDTKELLLDIGSGTVDLFNNDMIVRNGDRDLIGLLIRLARNGGAWDGVYLTSTTAGATPYTGLAAVLNDAGDGTTVVDTFAGRAVGLADMLIKYTWDGDANLDGLINADDYFLVDSGYITQAKGYYNGDFNYDGTINADDYFMIDSAYIGQTGPLVVGQPVDDPAMAAVRQPQQKRHAEPSVLAQLFSTDPVF
ncbi:MAG: GEVED domain-containing protein [Planctomycetota bacterium]|nr:GEVED domain-containing protein [Planctomycetota bacterium]